MRTICALILTASLSCATAQSKEVSISEFSELTIAGPFKVTLVKSGKCKLEIDYNGVDPDDVAIRVSGAELVIRVRQGIFDFDKYDDRHRKRALVTIYYTSLKDINVSKGSILRANETVSGDRLKLKSSMGSEMRLDLKVQQLTLDSSMGSEVDLAGTATHFELTAKMGSDVDAYLLKCQDVSVSASMGANVKVFAERELDASASFGASVSCKGNPPHKKTSGSFGSDFN
jgi:hypothetical protein